MDLLKNLKTSFNFSVYLKELVDRQNNTDIKELKNILNEKDYYYLLKNVLTVLKENEYHTGITTLRHQLFEKSGLKEEIKKFVYEDKKTPGLVLSFGHGSIKDTIVCGNKKEAILDNGNKIPYYEETEIDTIYDLASTSKLITTLAIYILKDAGMLDLHKTVREYCPQFKNLGSTTVNDLLKFKVNVITTKRVDNAKNPIEAESILFNAIINPNQDIINSYTDMGAMILKYVVELASKMKFNDFVYETIFKPYKMNDTGLTISYDKLHKVASNNFNSIVDINGNVIERVERNEPTSHDPKAKIMKLIPNNAPGHAGYFSTAKDMMILGDAIMNKGLLTKESLYDISRTETGKRNEEKEKYTHYYGSLTYLKQPDINNLSVYLPLSGRTFMSPGFAGTTLLVDPLNNISMFLGSNRLHNRIYQIPEQYKGIDKKYYKGIPISSTYTKDKEIFVKKAMDLAMQYQFLEILIPHEKEYELVREI